MAQVRWFTKYGSWGPSSRYRAYALQPGLEARGWNVSISPLQRGARRPATPVRGVECVRRGGQALRWDDDAIVVVQKEILPPRSVTEPLCRLLLPRMRYVWDIDDAVWANSAARERIARFHAQNAQAVVAGNEVIRRWVRESGQSEVSVIPTCTYVPDVIADTNSGDGSALKVGWIGSRESQRFLEDIAGVLLALSVRYSFDFEVMGGRLPASLRGAGWAKEVAWDPGKERDFVKGLDIGVGPLSGDEIARGKSGFKLIQYLSSGASVIAEDNEVHRSILDGGRCGLLVTGERAWYEALEGMLSSAEMRREFARMGHERARRHYSLAVAAEQWHQLLRQCREKMRCGNVV